MSIFKHVWNFSSSPGGDWSEVHHMEADTIEQSVDLIGQALIDKRLSILDDVNTLDSIDVIPVHPGGAGQQIPVERDGTHVDQTGPANLGEAARLTLNGSPNGRRFLWMRGVPEHFIERDQTTGKTRVLPEFSKSLVSILQMWRAVGYGVLVRTRAKPPGSAGAGSEKNFIDSVTYLAGGMTALTRTGTGTPPLVGEEISLGGFSPRLFPFLNGTSRVVKIDATGGGEKYLIRHTGVPLNVAISTSGGWMIKITWGVKVYNPAISPRPVLVTRQTKNEDTGSRGARSARGGRGSV